MRKTLSIGLLLLLGLQLRADLYLKIVNHTDALTVDGKTQPARDVPYEMWVGQDQLAGVNYNGPTVVLDFARKVLLKVDHQNRTFLELPLPLDRAHLEPLGMLPMFSGTATVTPLHQQKQLGDYRCDGYLVTMKVMGREMQRTIWATAQVKPEFSRYLNTYSRRDAMHFMDPESLRQMQKVAGFQIGLEATMETPGGPVKSTGRLQVMEERTPPAGIYSVPEGYRRQEPVSPGGPGASPQK